MTSNKAAPAAAGASAPSPTAAASGAPSAATYGTIDASAVSTPMWMMRLPPLVSKAWEDAPEGTVLGTLTFTKGSPPVVAPKKPPPQQQKQQQQKKPPTTKPGSAATKQQPQIQQSLTIKISNDLPTAPPDLPLEYSLEALTRRVPTLHPFVRRPNGSVQIAGTVSRTGNMQVNRNERYRNLCKNRLVASATTDRFVKPVDTADLTSRGSSRRPGAAVTGGGAGAGAGSGGFGDSVQKFGKALIDASQNVGTDNSRKRKFEGQNIRGVLFELFSSQQFWAVKDLRLSSGRTEKEIRPMLSELCDFHRSGENKGTWELKEEFRQGASASAAGAAVVPRQGGEGKGATGGK